MSSALFAEKRLEDIKRELEKEKDSAVAEALGRAKAEAEATVARLQVGGIRRYPHRSSYFVNHDCCEFIAAYFRARLSLILNFDASFCTERCKQTVVALRVDLSSAAGHRGAN